MSVRLKSFKGWAEHHQVWLGGIGALLTVMTALAAILFGQYVLHGQQGRNASDITRLNGTYIALLAQSSQTQMQCALLEASVKNNNERRAQVQKLVNAAVVSMSSK